MRATIATVTPAAINPYSTALVTLANTTRDVLRGYRKIELATALPPEVSLKPIAAKLAAKPFRAVKPGVSRNTTPALAAAARALLFRGNRRRPSDFEGFDLVAAVRKQ
jgi:hypothetical protein